MARNNRNRAERKPSSFADAPNEIINHILSFVPRSSLHSLCLVNKSLHVCAEPLLYSAITIKWTTQGDHPIIALLHTFRKRPELLASVDALILHGKDSQKRSSRSTPSLNLSRLAGGWFVPMVKGFNVPFSDDWVRGLQAAHIDAFAALLIAQLCKTTRLKIADNYLKGEMPNLICQVVQCKAYGQLPGFDRLRLMAFVVARHKMPEAFIPPFYVPTVTELSVSFSETQSLSWPRGEPDLGRLTSLDISGRSPTVVAGILSLATNLRSLSWEWGFSPRGTSLDFNKITKSLSPTQGILKIFRFRVNMLKGYLGHGDPEFAISGSFSGLADFAELMHLELPLVSLTGIGSRAQAIDRHLPRGIETLALSSGLIYEHVEWLPNRNRGWPDEGVMETIKGLDKTRSTTLPRLRRIEIIDNADCFPTRKLDKLLEEASLDIDVEVLRNIRPRDEYHIL